MPELPGRALLRTVYVSRGGIKLRHALDRFAVDPRGLACADFGCNVGGFTDCLLRAGAAKVYAVDTGYGSLAWTLRNDPRVVVMERVNALHVQPPQQVGLVAVDLGWTPQRHAIPAALRWLDPGGSIITLIKPHYETGGDEQRLLSRGVLGEADAERIARRVADELASLGARVLGLERSPIRGGASRARAGNTEWLALLRPA